MRFLRSTEAVSKPFGGEIARGKHLFPFRTEPLSLSAPMVLGGQPPGRVGRRRFFLQEAAFGRPLLVAWAHGRLDRPPFRLRTTDGGYRGSGQRTERSTSQGETSMEILGI